MINGARYCAIIGLTGQVSPATEPSEVWRGRASEARTEGLRGGLSRTHKLTSGTFFDTSAQVVDFLFLNNPLFGMIYEAFSLFINSRCGFNKVFPIL